MSESRPRFLIKGEMIAGLQDAGKSPDENIPGLMEESKNLYEAYKKQYSSNPFAEGTLEIGNKLIDTMKEEKEKRWEEGITSIDLTHNSRKAWQTIKKLSNDPTSPNFPCLVNSNQVAHHLLVKRCQQSLSALHYQL